MRTETINHHLRVIIEPGEQYSSSQPVTISTLLGSCIAACLYDPVHKVVGMNHFMLSQKRSQNEVPMLQSEAGRYGIHAMELLINAMLNLGAEKRLLKAKIFGGSTILAAGEKTGRIVSVGEDNIAFIRAFLSNEKIPLVAENVGGEEGRVIHYSSAGFKVYVRKIRSADKSRQLATRDRNCWLHAIEQQEKQNWAAENVELWM